MSQKIAFLTAFLLAASVSLTFAQEREVSGQVTNEAGSALPGVNIQIAETATGTTTDAEGEYTVTVSGPDAVLVFTFVGYQERRVTVGEQTTINVVMQTDVAAMDEVVVVGYGEQQRQQISGSVASVDVAEASVGNVESPQDLIQGRIAGASMVTSSGAPGAGVSFRIRGTSSVSANSDPLYVVDGVPISSSTPITPDGASAGGVAPSNTTNPLSTINPNNVESIEVLKDAAATSIYGSQGAAGVILIETKDGQEGNLRADFSAKSSVGFFARELDVLSGDEYRQALQKFLDADVSEGGSTDWQEATTRNPVTQEYNLSVSGATESTSYRASGNYRDQKGLLRNTGIERVSGKLSANHSALEEQLSLNAKLNASYVQRDHGFFNQGAGFEAGVVKSMNVTDPREPVRLEEGGFNDLATNIRNPVAISEEINDITDQTRILGNLRAEYDILEDLTTMGRVGVDVNGATRRTFLPKKNPIGEQIGGLARQASRDLTNITLQSTTRYNRDVLGNSFEILGGYEYKREVFQSSSVETRRFITDATGFNDLGGGKNVQTPSSSKEVVEQISFFGRVNYDIQEKYSLQASIRRDGSSVFGENERFAFFPSASGAWTISEEPFMQDMQWLRNLKLRVSWGESGNQAVPPFQASATLSTGAGFADFFGDENEVTGVSPERAPSPNLKWEETTEFNLGLDFSAWRFDGSFDVYRKKTDDLLLDVRVPQPAVSSFVLKNVGEVTNRGFELSLDANVLERSNMTLDINGTVSSNFNEVDDLGGRGAIDHGFVSGAGQSGVTSQRLEPGHPIGAFFAPVFAGIDEDGNETFELPDGGTTTILGEARRAFAGNPIPDAEYSFNIEYQYTGWDFSAFFRGEQGREVFNNTALEMTSKTNLGTINVLREAVNDGTNLQHVQTFSTRWIEDAGFLRLDKLTLGYTFQNPDRFNLRRLRVYASGSNVFEITPYEGTDPEFSTDVDQGDTDFRGLSRPNRGIDFHQFPSTRTFTFGLELGL
jgi:iron complex outermembrane receptor protein